MFKKYLIENSDKIVAQVIRTYHEMNIQAMEIST